MMATPADISNDAPRCLTCGYILLGLADCRCPECGSPFDPEDAAFRSSLLPWERPEAGGHVARLIKTLLQASFHPVYFFTILERRKDRPITRAPMFILACLLVSVCFYATEFLLRHAVFFVHELVEQGNRSQALDSVLFVVDDYWKFNLILPPMRMLQGLLSVAVITLFILWLFRGKLGSLRRIDLAAVYTPAVAFGAFIVAIERVVVAVLGPYDAWTVIHLDWAASWAQLIALLVLLGFSCRRLLHLSRSKTVGMLIVGVVLDYVCGFAVDLLWPIFK